MAVAGVVMLGAGCKFGPKFEPSPPPLPDSWSESDRDKFEGEPVSQTEWWKSFDDPVLDLLIERAFEENLTLQAASLRVVQARIGRSAAIETLFPITTGAASVTHSKLGQNVTPDVDVNLPGGGPVLPQPLVSIRPKIDVYDVGFDAIWELDLWGENRRLIESKTAAVEAAYAGYDDVMVSLAGEVAATYVQRQVLRQRLATMRQNVGVMKEFEAVAQERFDNGESPETDVLLARTLVAAIAVGVPKMEDALQQTENALCILLGKAPHELDQELSESDGIPAAPALIAVGIPADLLRRRPDVRMAERLAHSECARIGMAKAAIMPSFNLLGAFGWSSSHSGDLFDGMDSKSYTYGGLVKVTGLLNYPFTVERVRMADARFEEAMLQYQSYVLNAAREVENAMTAFVKSRDEQVILEDGSEAAIRAAQLAVGAYKQGKVIVSVPLVALTFQANMQDQFIAARGSGSKNLISMYKALGGGWEIREGQDLVPAEIQERMKDRTDWWSFFGKSDLNTANPPGNETAQ